MLLATALAGHVVVIPVPGATVSIVILVREAVEESAEAASRAAVAASLA